VFGSHYILNRRARVLWALDRALGLARERETLVPLAARIAAAPAERAVHLGEQPWVLMWSAVLANLTRHEVPISDALLDEGLHHVAAWLEGDERLPAFTAPGPEGLTLVGDHPLVRVLVGDNPTPIAALDADWAPKLAAGLELLARVSPAQHARVHEHVQFVASFDAEPGLLQSLSAGEWPGFVLLRCMNSAPHVADQLVHETSHQLLDATFARRPELVAQIRAAPSAYSPFFTQPRPCIKLVHGLVSYLEVLRCWRGILDAGAVEATIAQARYDHVYGLCREGLRSLLAAAPSAHWPEWHAFLREVSPMVDAITLESPRPLDRLRETARTLGFTRIQEAELLLAVHGHKISRLSVSLDQGRELARALSPSLVPLFSRQVMVARTEHLKGSFSNLTEATFEYYKPPPGAFVYGYVGADAEKVRQAAQADESDQAGALLDIPECCRAFFAAHWDEAREHYEGDLASWLAQHDADGAPRWQCNPFAMYFDGGLTWHFPCSWRCAATVEVIDRRLAALRAIAPELAEALERLQRTPTLFSPNAGIAAGGLMLAETAGLRRWVEQGIRPEDGRVFEWR
jgi:hypothetical protein